MFQIAKWLFKAGWILLTMPVLLWRLSIALLAVFEFSIGVMATTPEVLERAQLREGKSPEAAKAAARYGRIVAKGIWWFRFLLPYIWFVATSAATAVLIVAGISLIAIGSIFTAIMIIAATIAAWPTFVPWLVDNVDIDIPLISGVTNAQTVTRFVAVAIVSLIAWSFYRTQNKRVKKLETLWEDQFGIANLAPIRKTPPSKLEIYIQDKLETWKRSGIQAEHQRRREKKRRQESRSRIQSETDLQGPRGCMVVFVGVRRKNCPRHRGLSRHALGHGTLRRRPRNLLGTVSGRRERLEASDQWPALRKQQVARTSTNHVGRNLQTSEQV